MFDTTSVTSVSGLYWWLAADSLSLNDGDEVLSWTDLSGEGNTVTGTSGNCPIYKTNQVRSYPCLRFTDRENLTAAASSSADLSEGTWFVVYNGVGGSGVPKCLISNEGDTRSQWCLAIGEQVTNTSIISSPSGWLYITDGDSLGRLGHWAKGDTFIPPYASGDWRIRSDRSAGEWHSFFLNGNVLGSSNAVGSDSDMSLIPGWGGELGVCNARQTISEWYVSGGGSVDIAEIICYNREISNLEMDRVNDYLKFKYLIGGVSPCDLYTSGGTPSSTSGNLSSQTDLYIGSNSTVESGVELYTASNSMWGGVVNLYACNKVSIDRSMDLYTLSSQSITDHIDMYASGMGHLTAARGLITKGFAAPFIQKSAPLYSYAAQPPLRSIYGSINANIRGVSAQASMNMNISGSGDTQAFAYKTLFLKTTEVINPASRSTSLFIQNSVERNSKNVKMFIRGNGSLDGGYIANGSIELYINRLLSDICPLYIYGGASSSSGIDLCAAGGMYNFTPLYVNGSETTKAFDSIPLVINTVSVLNKLDYYAGGEPLIFLPGKIHTQELNIFSRDQVYPGMEERIIVASTPTGHVDLHIGGRLLQDIDSHVPIYTRGF